MKKKILVLVILCSAYYANSTSTCLTVTPKNQVAYLTSTAPKPECSFTASVAINIVGQTASITCTSNQPSCEVAINDVAKCLKIAKVKLQNALGF